MKNRLIKKVTRQVADDELLRQINLAQNSGSHDIISAQVEAARPNVPNAIDKERFYGDFYDNIKPDIKELKGTLSRSMSYNGDTFDRLRNNQEFVLLKKISYEFVNLKDTESPIVVNYNARGCIVLVDSNGALAADQFQVRIEGRELASGAFYTILLTPVITGNLLYVLKIYPGLNPLAGFITNDILPRVWRVSVVHTTVNPILFGVTASMIV